MRWTLPLWGWLILAPAAAAPAPLPKPEGLPAEVVAAWEKAGAEIGWMGPSRQIVGMLTFTAEREELVAKQAVPAFRFIHWREGMLKNLPAPTQAFGLDLAFTEMTDPGLKELAPVKHLTSLRLEGARMTKDGVSELQKSLPHCRISH